MFKGNFNFSAPKAPYIPPTPAATAAVIATPTPIYPSYMQATDDNMKLCGDTGGTTFHISSATGFGHCNNNE